MLVNEKIVRYTRQLLANRVGAELREGSDVIDL